MRLSLVAIQGCLLTGGLVASMAVAHADSIPCGPVEPNTLQVDGLLDDWNGVTGLELGDGSSDFSVTVRCNYEPRGIFLMVNVRDDYLVRTKENRPGEDHVEVAIATGPGPG